MGFTDTRLILSPKMHLSVSTAQSIGTNYGKATAGGMCLIACKERGGGGGGGLT